MLKNEIDYNEKQQKEIAKILKSKRLENKMNLEDLSDGICSVSYLSRMENGYVKLQEPYIKQLFEKLNIDYDDLKKSRQTNLFLDIIKKNLLNQKNDYKKLIEKIVSSNHYLDVEQELILLYDALLNKRFDEAEMVMEEIDKSNYIYSDNERIFYMYLITRYYYETNQICLANHHIKSILSEKIEDELLYWVVYELNLQILFVLGKDYFYINDYNNFIKNSPSYYFSNKYIIHQFKMYVIMAKYDYKLAITKINDYFKEISTDDEIIKNEYKFHLGLIYLMNKKYELLIEELLNLIDNQKIFMLITIAYMNVKNYKIYPLIMNKINNYAFSKYDELLKQICIYTKYKITSNNVVNLQNILKNKIFKYIEDNNNIYIEQIFKNELIEINIRCSKYKEACNLMLSKFN